jgi:hypothetical protein
MGPADGVSTFVGSVVMGALVIIANHAVRKFRGENPLDLPAAKRAGDPGAVFPVVGKSRADAEILSMDSVCFTAAFFEFPTVH